MDDATLPPGDGPPRDRRPAVGPDRPPTAGEYEFRVITLPARVSRAEARQLLTEHAEYGRWELARVRLYAGGTRQVWLRRRIIRVARSA
jgi:hypothetical protein